MTETKSLILKTRCFTIFNLGKINKVLCVIDAENIYKLLSYVNLAANPRESKKNKVTSSIIDTLTTSPEEMVNRTKGLLVSTQKCKQLERGRFQLVFEDDKTDGVLDGGHNLLAIGTFLLEKFYENTESISNDLSKIKCWDDFSHFWKKYSDGLEDFVKSQTFLIPVEIIYPSNDEEYFDFAELVFEISDARNNNSPLTAGTKADHRGYYDSLKREIDPRIGNDITWKDNESGKRIKRDDIVALSLIPMIALQRKGKLDKNINIINPSIIYNSKAKCVELYSKIIECYKDKDDILPRVIKNALALMKDIPLFYDKIYIKFPDAYNSHSPRFGGINVVNVAKKDSKDKYKTKFYKYDSDYSYPDGYILPFVSSLHELIKIDGDNVYWETNVSELIEDNAVYKMLVGTIKDNNFDPQKVGKSSAAYTGCEMSMRDYIMRKASINS